MSCYNPSTVACGAGGVGRYLTSSQDSANRYLLAPSPQDGYSLTGSVNSLDKDLMTNFTLDENKPHRIRKDSIDAQKRLESRKQDYYRTEASKLMYS